MDDEAAWLTNVAHCDSGSGSHLDSTSTWSGSSLRSNPAATETAALEAVMPEGDAREVNLIGTPNRSTSAAEDAIGMDGVVGFEVAGGVGEAGVAEVNPMGTPKRSIGAAEDAAGVYGAIGVEVGDG